MRIERIEVSYQVTQALPNYCNFKPSVSVSAVVEPGDDPVEVESQLWQHVKQTVHDQVDQELERHGQPARFSMEPRFDVIGLPDKTTAIIPTGQQGLLKRRCIFHHSGLRLQHAWRVAEKYANSNPILDCSNDLGLLHNTLDNVERWQEAQRNRHSGEVSLPF